MQFKDQPERVARNSTPRPSAVNQTRGSANLAFGKLNYESHYRELDLELCIYVGNADEVKYIGCKLGIYSQ